jgi:hypothetical protein
MPNIKVIDGARTMRFASFGFFIHGTGGHFFYGWMDRFLPGTAMYVLLCRRVLI